MKKYLIILLTLFMMTAMASSVLAFKGPVTAIDGKVVTMTIDGPIPPWVAKGAIAKTLGGLAKVVALDGQVLQLKVKKSTAKKLKAGEVIEVKPKSAAAGQTLQGC